MYVDNRDWKFIGIEFGEQTCKDKKNKQNECRKNTNNGDRWRVEGFYSRFKRQFGEYVFSRKSGNVEKEIIAKTNLQNFYITS